MTELNYVAPDTLKGAIKLVSSAKGKSKILAGGTDLIVQMRADMVVPDTIIDVKRIPELTAVTFDNGDVHIGAAVSGAELNENDSLKKMWPGILEAIDLIGSTQIQGRATLGGNVCNGSPAADSVPALIAANAVARIMGSVGMREVPVDEFLVGPGKSILERDEVLVSICLPKQPIKSADAYLRFIPRTEMDIAAVGVAINLTLNENDICISARVSLGAVAERALLVPEAGDILIGTSLEESVLDKLAEIVMNACRPIDDKRGTKEFRTHVAGTLVRRVAIVAFERARLS